MTRDDAVAWAEQAEVDLMFADGFDDAIVGIGQRFNSYFLIYDTEKVLDVLMDRDGMSYEDAQEYFDFNVVGSWVTVKRGPDDPTPVGDFDGPPCFLITNA